MRVVFVYNGAENLGIEYLSSYLKSFGHEVHLAFDPAPFSGNRGSQSRLLAKLSGDMDSRVVNKVVSLEPDLVCCSAYTANYRWLLGIASRIKEKSPHILNIFGGVHTTAVPHVVLDEPAVDAVVVGEGEEALLELVGSIRDGRFSDTSILNAGFKGNGTHIINPVRPYIRELDKLPLPDKEMFFDKVPSLEEAYLIMTSRGCPFTCSYCMNNLYPRLYSDERGHVRRRSVSNVLEELAYYHARGRMKLVTFWDDVFPLKVDWLEEFAERYPSEIGLPYLCYVHPNLLSEHVADLLVQSGCAGVKIGVQTLSVVTRKSVLGRSGSKDRIMKTAKILRSRGIPYSMDHIFGLPGEGVEEQEDAARFYVDVKPARINTHWLTIFPGTDIIDTALKDGSLDDNKLKDIEMGVNQQTFMFASEGDGRNLKPMMRYQMFFDLVPLLPLKWLNRILNGGHIKRIPYSATLHKLLVVIAALKTRDQEIVGYVKYAFGKKKAP